VQEEKFGALFSVGPFPVETSGNESQWFFPAPADLKTLSTQASIAPAGTLAGITSLKSGLLPLGSRIPPSKDPAPQWLSQQEYEAYLRQEDRKLERPTDSRFFEAEHTIGIGLDSDTNATEEGKIYSRAQMRLRETARLGALAQLPMVGSHSADFLEEVFPSAGKIRLGGESRVCTVERRTVSQLPLPSAPKCHGRRIKWILLTPAIFQAVRTGNRHPGGWLPNWVREEDGTLQVKLVDGPGAGKARRLRAQGKSIAAPREIRARLVAAAINRPQIVSGWAQSDGQSGRHGARSTLLAVPAGSVYYFEAESEDDAQRLVSVLNWHGLKPAGGEILNLRSGLLGEKGFGLGVCTTWQNFEELNI